MLNSVLFEAIRSVSPEVAIVHENETGQYQVHAGMASRLAVKRRAENKAAFVTQWGETYQLNCPVCGDQRRRLFICHLLGVHIGKGANRLRFSRGIARCHNAGCNIYQWLMSLPDIDWNNLELLEGVSPVKHKGDGLSGEVALPDPSIPLLSSGVPQIAYDYLLRRGYDPEQMYADYRLHYAPVGSVWNPLESHALREPRIVIPMFRGGLLVGWQARDITDTSKIKYLTTPGWKKTEVLYNMDVAKWYNAVVLVEGPTDAWRVGPNAMALMGKSLSATSTQAKILKTLWGDRGRCLICLDSYEDDPDTVESAVKIMKVLVEIGAFPKGIGIFNLPNKDPGSWDHDELEAKLNQCFNYMDR